MQEHLYPERVSSHFPPFKHGLLSHIPKKKDNPFTKYFQGNLKPFVFIVLGDCFLRRATKFECLNK